MITKVRAPKGYQFKIGREKTGCNCDICLRDSRYNKVVYLMNDKKEVGHINLIRKRKGVYETHSWLNDDYRNKGLGALMYAKAIQWCHEHGYSVSSSSAPSYDARRVWKGKTLRKFFLILKRSAKSRTFFAYPK